MATSTSDPCALRRFNQALLAQALALAALHETPGVPAYAKPVGAHLRHVIEHYEALLTPEMDGIVDYDARRRDAALEASPRLAQLRLIALQRRLEHVALDLQQPLTVRGLAGLGGEVAFALPSSLGRELVFVASHAVHHFALLVPHLRQHGLPLPGEGFGIAPATLAHARQLATPSPSLETA